MKVHEIISGLKNKTLKPITIAEHFLRCYDNLESKVHAWEEYDRERILTHYQGIDIKKINWSMNTLACVPLGVKDCYNTEDFFTRRGSPIYANYRAGNDARLVRKFRDEGCFVFGKTTTAELSVHLPAKTRNPYNLIHAAGTSSGGSACAVATGMVPIALGTQTAASTSKPCSFCGVYGFKPTFGMFPRTGVLKTCDSLDTLTLIASCIEDIEYVFDNTRLKGENYPLIHKLPEQREIDFNHIRIGVIFDGASFKSSEFIHKDFYSIIEKIKQIKNIKIEVLELPSFLENIHNIHHEIYVKSLSYYFKDEYTKHPEHISDVLKEMILEGQKISTEYYVELLKMQALQNIHFHDWLKKHYDFIFTPATMGAAPEGLVDYTEKDFSLIWTYLGLPLLIAPAFKALNGLPYGLQICSAKYTDEQLLKFGKLLKANDVIADVNIVSTIK